MSRTLITLTLLWLTACAMPILRYQEPTQGPRARVRFVTDSTDAAILRVYDDSNCTLNETEWMRLGNRHYLKTNPKTLGLPLWHYNESAATEVYVEAGKPLNAMFFGAERALAVVFSCATPFSFSFSENTDYEVSFRWSRKQCFVTISQFVHNGDSWFLSEVAKFDNQVDTSNSGCLAEFKKWRFF